VNGPIEGSFVVYEDFFSYKRGIYVPTTSQIAGYHAIKVVGFGYDGASHLNYWIAANSWGSDWGEDGYFRIASGTAQFDNINSFVGGSVN
jgi:cathepsin B